MSKRRRGVRAGKKVQHRKRVRTFAEAAAAWKAARAAGESLRARLRRITVGSGADVSADVSHVSAA